MAISSTSERWPLGSNPAGTDGALNVAVYGLVLSGSDLYVGGLFTPPELVPYGDPPLSDVWVDNPFCAEIKWMKEAGITTGFADGTYRPANEVTRQAMAAFLLRVSFLLP